jgi:glycosyltransferase involved in cell wall biosynthesis
VLWIAALILGVSVMLAVESVLGFRRFPSLQHCPPREDRSSAPRVAVVVAARNEAANLESATRSLLALDYPQLEFVIVDDRSTDATGAILARLAANDPRVRALRVAELPAGWLGKNHALQTGADATTADWILFTDADVHFHPETVSRAIRYCEERQVDHLAALPELILPGWLLEGFAVLFGQAFVSFTKPWKARDPKSRHFIGVGAFNLVRRAAYQAVGGHRSIALRPDDDMKLGKILKRGGFHQDAVQGTGMLKVVWYRSLGELVRGLEKNMFAGIDYSIVVSVLSGLAQLALGVFPLVAAVFTSGVTQGLFLAQVVGSVITFAWVAGRFRMTRWVALIYPVAVLLFVGILWRTMVLNLSQGGLSWRGTFYPLAQLKANRV